MQDTALYETVLGLERPWSVVRVDLKPLEETVEVWVESRDRRLPCPVCGALCAQHDTRPRWWRHLDTCQFRTLLCAAVPRVRCLAHGVKQVRVPWADPGSRFTALFEAWVLRWLQEASISAVSDQFGLSWNVIDRLLQRAVRRGFKRRLWEETPELPQHLSIDETSFQKRHEYVTVVSDQARGHVVHVGDGRTCEAVCEYLMPFPEEDRAEVQTVAMDMCAAYISAIQTMIPEAERKICFDKFHVAQHLSKAIDQVRRREHKHFLAAGESPLKKTRYLWLQRAEHLHPERRLTLEALLHVATRTARAWAIKEACMAIWRYRSRGWARKALRRWYAWAIRSRLDPIKRVARTVKNHLEGIINAMYHGITNASAESINSRIQWIKYTARGFRSRERFRTAIYFHLGGLDMTPEALKPIRLHTR